MASLLGHKLNPAVTGDETKTEGTTGLDLQSKAYSPTAGKERPKHLQAAGGHELGHQLITSPDIMWYVGGNVQRADFVVK